MLQEYYSIVMSKRQQNFRLTQRKKIEQNLRLVIICCLRASFLYLLPKTNQKNVKCQQNFHIKTKQQSKCLNVIF